MAVCRSRQKAGGSWGIAGLTESLDGVRRTCGGVFDGDQRHFEMASNSGILKRLPAAQQLEIQVLRRRRDEKLAQEALNLI